MKIGYYSIGKVLVKGPQGQLLISAADSVIITALSGLSRAGSPTAGCLALGRF